MARFGRGCAGFGVNYWPAGLGRGLGMGRGMGNPYPFCRFYPWLPRRWWAMGITPYAAPYQMYGAYAPRSYIPSPPVGWGRVSL